MRTSGSTAKNWNQDSQVTDLPPETAKPDKLALQLPLRTVCPTSILQPLLGLVLLSIFALVRWGMMMEKIFLSKMKYEANVKTTGEPGEVSLQKKENNYISRSRSTHAHKKSILGVLMINRLSVLCLLLRNVFFN